MSCLAWTVMGMVIGFLGSKLVNRHGEGLLFDVMSGIAGALVGGYLFVLYWAHGVTRPNVYTLLAAVVGSVVFLVVYRGSAELFRRMLQPVKNNWRNRDVLCQPARDFDASRKSREKLVDART
jgi:uncharacterized membrane protein YeaQ/YmgE (transglycosylase-associated protein family)